MTELLVRLFIRDAKGPGARTRFGNLASVTGLFINLLLSAIKFVAGSLSGSLAITADAVNNLSDSLSSILSLLSFRLSARPADEEHPYGHSRAELLLSMLVGASILYVGGKLLVDSAGKVLSPSAIVFDWLVAAILLVSMALKGWLWAFYRNIGQRIGSEMLKAVAADSISDVFSTLGVLVSVLLSGLMGIHLDGIMGIIVSLLILKNGYDIVRENVSRLLGQGANTEEGEKLLAFIKAQEHVLGAHDLLIHEYGGQQRYATVDCEVDAGMTVEEAHRLVDGIEREVAEKFGYHLVIHVDPVREDDHSLQRCRRDVEDALRRHGGSYSYHDLHVLREGRQLVLYFDLLIPAAQKVDESAAVQDISRLLQQTNPRYRPIIRVDRTFE